MKLLKILTLFILLLLSSGYASNSTDEALHLLVENDVDFAIAKDIQKTTRDKMNLTIYYDNYLGIVDKLLTDKKAQFGILPHDMMLYKKYLERDKTFINKVKMIMPLYDKHIHILVRKDQNITAIKDLKGKRVNTNIGKNSFSLTGEIMKYKHNISWKTSHYKTNIAIEKLLKNEIDAVVLIESKPSKSLSEISKGSLDKLTLLSPELTGDYPVAYLNKRDYSWLNKEVTTNLVSVILASYNYHESKTVKRFNYYTKNITNVVDLITLDIDRLRERGYYLWKNIEPFYYRKVQWPLHSLSKNAIHKDMDRLDSFTNTIGMKFVTIDAGNLAMGSDNPALPADEQPIREYKLNSFHMLTTEVTQKQWLYIMKKNPSFFDAKKLNHHSDLNPVENISFKDAKFFIDTLNSLEGRSNYRLPTEMEWEYAASGDEHNLSHYAWYGANSSHETKPVGLKQPNKWGLYDMLGNVWEWCDSPYTKDYNSDIGQNGFMVLRGGSFINLPANVRNKNRMNNRDTIRRFNNGFRIVYDKNSIAKDNIKYRVQLHDTLSGIAEKFYQDSKRWDIIFYANKSIIGRKPSNIKKGQVLKIPFIRSVAFGKTKSEADRDITENRIKFLSERNMVPFSDPSLPHGGMLNHILEASMDSIGEEDYTINWENDATLFFPYLKEHKFDVGVGWLKPDCSKPNLSKETTARCEFLFSDPIVNKITTFFRIKTKKQKILTVNDLKGKRICRKKGWYVFDLEEQGLIPGKTIHLIQPDSMEKCFNMLLNSEVDYVAATKIVGNQITENMSIDAQIESIEEISTLLSSHFIVHKSNPRADEILDKLSRGMHKLITNGKMQKIKMDHAKNFFYKNQ